MAKISVNPELEIHVNRALVFVLARAGARRDIAKPRKPAANYFIKSIQTERHDFGAKIEDEKRRRKMCEFGAKFLVNLSLDFGVNRGLLLWCIVGHRSSVLAPVGLR